MLRRAGAYLSLMHPWPVSMVVLVTFAASLFATRSLEPRPWLRICLVVLTIFFSQYCVGVTNEYIDRHTDMQSRPDKPIPAGYVEPGMARRLAIVCGVTATLIALPLGWFAAFLATLGTVFGLLYDLGLKRTAWSWLPYVLGFALLPNWIFYALGVWNPILLWLYPLTGLLITGTHLANTLPDVETDTAQGEHGLAVVLGKQRALLVCWACYLVVPVVALLPALWHHYTIIWYILGATLSVAITLTAIFRYRAYPTNATLRQNWRLLTLSAAFLAGGWLAAALV